MFQGTGVGVQGSVKNFKDLKVWQKAYQLSLLIYKVTKTNIAEGYSRKGRMEYIQFLSIAYSSLSELETQVLLSKDLKYISNELSAELINLEDELGAMLYRLMQKLNPSFDKKEALP